MKNIVFIHGRGFTPSEHDFRKLLIDAMAYGILRDCPKLLPEFENASKNFAYFGNISSTFLAKKNCCEIPKKINSYLKTFERLKRLKKDQFSREYYEKLKNPISKLDSFANYLEWTVGNVDLAEWAIRAVLSDIGEYWNPDSSFGSDIRYSMINPLRNALDNGGDVCIISHSLGTMIAFDTLWKLSRSSDYRGVYDTKKIDTWITLGTPLGNRVVQRNLKGAQARNERRYPSNIRRWVNISAVDDYVSHDHTIADDFKFMVDNGLCESIEDHVVYNPSVRDGVVNPHHITGYFIHPNCIRAIEDFLLA